MERVALLVEATGERLGCLLNPNNLVVQRRAGVRPRQSATGLLSGAGVSDDPLLYTGGGSTSLTLDLLFDIRVAGSTIGGDDVRDLTRPLWDLAENADVASGPTATPLVRFVWGKAWNVPGVVTAVAERVEDFNVRGVPARSWLRMRLARVPEDAAATDEGATRAPSSPAPAAPAEGLAEGVPEIVTHRVLGQGPDSPGERLEDIAFLYYGNPALWRLLAAANGIDDPGRVAPGTVLEVPPTPQGAGGR
jgi:hypothetical protein